MKFFLPLLFVAYVGGISLFTHFHVVNGVTIVHSHPFAADSGHDHSTSEILVIALLSHLQAADGAVAVLLLALCLVLIYQLFYKATDSPCRNFSRGRVGLRAPPVFSL